MQEWFRIDRRDQAGKALGGPRPYKAPTPEEYNAGVQVTADALVDFMVTWPSHRWTAT